jgi:hypothetical protein
MKIAILGALLAAGSGSLGAIETAKGIEWSDVRTVNFLDSVLEQYSLCLGVFPCSMLLSGARRFCG